MLDSDCDTTSAHTTTDTKVISNAWKISETYLQKRKIHTAILNAGLRLPYYKCSYYKWIQKTFRTPGRYQKLTFRNKKYNPQYSMLDYDSHTTSAHTTTDTKDISNAWKISENLPTETKNTYRNAQCWTPTAILQVLILQLIQRTFRTPGRYQKTYLQKRKIHTAIPNARLRLPYYKCSYYKWIQRTFRTPGRYQKLTFRNEKYIPQYSMLDFDSHTTSAHTTTDTKDISNAWKISENLTTETKNTYRNAQCWTLTAILQVLMLQLLQRSFRTPGRYQKTYLQKRKIHTAMLNAGLRLPYYKCSCYN